MKRIQGNVSGPVALSLLLLTTPVLADISMPNSGFTYKDDWAVVSAPPPPGPYRAVNIDPRVPGADTVPPLPMDAMTASGQGDIPTEVLADAPAAGMPATPSRQDNPAAALVNQQPTQPVSPRHSNRVPPAPQGNYYPPSPRYPAQTRRVPPPAYPGYGSQPGYGGGYYGSPYYRQGQPQVPPPPVYDAMMRNQHPYGYQPGKGTP